MDSGDAPVTTATNCARDECRKSCDPPSGCARPVLFDHVVPYMRQLRFAQTPNCSEVACLNTCVLDLNFHPSFVFTYSSS